MESATLIGLVLGSTVLVELVKQAGQGLMQRRRAKREVETERDRLVRSRNVWQEHALRLRALISRKGFEPPDLPDDPWPGKQDN